MDLYTFIFLEVEGQIEMFDIHLFFISMNNTTNAWNIV